MKASEITSVLIVLGALVAPTGSQAATVDLVGDACGGAVERGVPFSVRGIASDLEPGEMVGLRVVFGVDEMDEVLPITSDDFRLGDGAFVPELVEGPVIHENWASFAAVAIDGATDREAPAELFALTLTPSAAAAGAIRVALTEAYGSCALFADESERDLVPGAPCEVYVDGESPPPEAPVAVAGSDVVVLEGRAVRLDGLGSLDRTPPEDLTFRWELIAGPGSLSDAETVVATYRAPDDILEDADATARLTVTDPVAGLSSEDQVAVHVTAVADAPIADAGRDQEVEAGGIVVLDGRASRDREGEDNLQFSWRIVDGRGELEGFGEPIATYRAPTVFDKDVRTVIELGVLDPDVHEADFDTVTIVVRPAPAEPPTPDAGPDRAVVEGGRVALDGSASVDAVGADNLTFAWRVAQGPGAIVDAEGAMAIYVAPEDVFEVARARLELTVTDPDSGLTAVGVLAVTVTDEVPPGCYDFDGDGFHIEVGEGETANARVTRCGFVDCAETNPLVRPFTIELPNDGIDQNCNGSQTCGTLASGPAAGPFSGAAALGIAFVAMRRRIRHAP
ncbi:MAG: putative metal-binding motif-containing protein [Myxococcales bacterium]|nr:putative metal-binding motif-containing protein [Myxococcales bacterium]